MLPARGSATADRFEIRTALGSAIMVDDDGTYGVTKLGPHGCIDWQASVRGWSAQQVRDVILSRALDEIGGAG